MKISSSALLLSLVGAVSLVTVVDGFQIGPNSRISSLLTTSTVHAPPPQRRTSRSSRLFDASDDSEQQKGDDQWDETPQKIKDPGFLEGIKEWFSSEEGGEDVRTYITSLTVALLLRLLIIEPRYIPSLSMYPTFEVGDQLAVEKVTKRIRPFNRNSVVVFNPPIAFREVLDGYNAPDTAKKAREALIKRIVAVEVSVVKMSGVCVCGSILAV